MDEKALGLVLACFYLLEIIGSVIAGRIVDRPARTHSFNSSAESESVEHLVTSSPNIHTRIHTDIYTTDIIYKNTNMHEYIYIEYIYIK